MRIAALTAATLNCAISSAAYATAPTVGGISLGDTLETVLAVLGPPERTVKTGDALDPQLEYEGLTIWFWEGRGVEQIRSTSAKYCLVQNLCPGDSIADLRAKLGTPQDRPDAGEGHNEYAVEDTCWLEVSVADRVVTALEIKCQP